MGSGLDLALELASRPSHGIGIGACDAWHRTAAPVDRAPAAVALGPGDAAKTRREKDQIVELRLDHHLPGRVDQPPLAVLEKGEEAEIEVDADSLCADVDPGLAGRRQDHALAVGLRHDGVADIAHDAS